MTAGSVRALLRFPVKSMGGERIATACCTTGGLLGDRAYALIDPETGRVASAADPRRWAALLRCSATFVEEPTRETLPPVLIRLPDGSMVASDDTRVDAALSKALGARVALVQSMDSTDEDALLLSADRVADGSYWLSVLEAYGTKGNAAARPPIGNVAPLHLVTTAAMRQVHQIVGGAHPVAERLRPNVVIEWPGTGFVENDWPSRRVAIGDVDVEVLMPTPRCVLPTLPTADDPDHDRRLMQAARHNRVTLAAIGASSCLGVYGRPVASGVIAVGAPVAVSN